MSFDCPGEVHLRFLDEEAAHLREVPGAGPPDLVRLPMQRQIDKCVVREESAELNPTAGVCGEATTQYLDIVTPGEVFGGARDLRAFGVRVRQPPLPAIETYRQVGVV